jgi:hypothetical protein
MASTPRMTERYEHFIELVFFNSPDVQSWVVGAANSLNNAFSSVTTMFSIPRSGTYRSRTIRRKGLGRVQYTNRGLARANYDPEDFWVGGGTLPHDFEVSYLRVSEVSNGGVTRPAGPILIVPSKNFFTNTRPKLTIAGTAPNVAATTTGIPPEGAMHFVLPRFADSATLVNSGGQSLFISFNEGEPEFEVPNGETMWLNDAAFSEVYVRGNGATVDFTFYVAIVNAEMA